MGLRLVKIVRAHAWCPLGDEKKSLTANELRLALHAALTARDSDPEPWFEQPWQVIARALGHDRPDAKATLNTITAAARGLVEKGFWRIDRRAAGGADGQQGRPVRYVITAWGALKDGGTDSEETTPPPVGDGPEKGGTVYADGPEILGSDSRETVPNSLGTSPTSPETVPNSLGTSPETVPGFLGDGPRIPGRRSQDSWDLRNKEEINKELSARSARARDAATIIRERTGCTSDEAAAVVADLRATRPHIRSLAAVLPSITDDELGEALDGVRARRRQAALAMSGAQRHEYRAGDYDSCRVCGLPRENWRHQKGHAA